MLKYFLLHDKVERLYLTFFFQIHLIDRPKLKKKVTHIYLLILAMTFVDPLFQLIKALLFKNLFIHKFMIMLESICGSTDPSSIQSCKLTDLLPCCVT